MVQAIGMSKAEDIVAQGVVARENSAKTAGAAIAVPLECMMEQWCSSHSLGAQIGVACG
jgi:catalase (peroxidase I)